MDLNIRNLDDALYTRAKAVAESRWTKREAPMKRLVVMALQRLLAEELNGGCARPRLKLCANCFAVNIQRAQEVRSYAIPAEALAGATEDASPFSQAEGSRNAPSGAQEGRHSPFAHLLGENLPESLEAASEAALEGLAGASARPSPDTPLIPAVVPATNKPELTEVAPRLWVGKDRDRLQAEEKGWSILAAAKDPWHRDIVGYSTFAAPKDSPEFFAARRDNCLYLNFVDVRKLGPKGETYVAPEVLSAAQAFLVEQLGAGHTVLIHCNQGRSRGPFLAFLYLWRTGVLPKGLMAALTEFQKRYPAFKPSAGITKYLDDRMATNEIPSD